MLSRQSKTKNDLFAKREAVRFGFTGREKNEEVSD